MHDSYIYTYISYNTGKSTLPDTYARCPRVRIYQAKPRGPTPGEISHALAEITKIKFEFAKSSSLKRKSQASAEIRNQSKIYNVSVKSS